MKKVVITGCVSGIGRATADLFRERGDSVQELNLPDFDVRKLDIITGYTPDEPLDVFVNNAGIMSLTDYENSDISDWQNTIDTNLRAPYFLFQRVIPHIKDGGSLIVVCSTSSVYPEESMVVYSVAKAGLLSLTKSMARRYGHRIRVNAVLPGFVDTKIVPEPPPQRMIDNIPLKRMASAKEIAEVIWFLTQHEYMNGASIVCDGGLLARFDGPKGLE